MPCCSRPKSLVFISYRRRRSSKQRGWWAH